ncbi:MAG: hydroxyacylglutathione hydrolase, partial [Legionellales bacterium]
MKVVPVTAFVDNYIWILIDEDSGSFDCVDPGDAQPLIQWAAAHHLNLRAILLTHHHQDHIGGVPALIDAFPHGTVYGPDDIRIPQVHKILKNNDLITLGSNHFQILSNPGHTSTHISYFEPQKKGLFCGDTLFSAGCGRVFDGTMHQLHDSLQMFKKLPPSTQIYCGHEYTQKNLNFAQTVEPENVPIQTYRNRLTRQPPYCTLPSTLEQELLINPFLRTEIDAVKKYALSHG